MRYVVAILCILGVQVSSANAQWLYQGDESAFGGGGMHMAIAGNGSYALAIRCENGEADVVYLTPEEIKPEDAAVMSALKPKIMLRVDDEAVVETVAEIDSANGVLRATSPTTASFAEQVKSAKKRVAVALGLGGQTFHEQKFNARGSTTAIGKVMTSCSLPTN